MHDILLDSHETPAHTLCEGLARHTARDPRHDHVERLLPTGTVYAVARGHRQI
jgi:hypothetical protein